jgi:hypothetical protein
VPAPLSGPPPARPIRAAPVGDNRAVLGRDIVLEGDNPIGSRQARLVHIVLDGHRHAMQGTEVFLAPHRGIGGFGNLQYFLREHADKGVDPRVHRRQPIEAGAHRCAAGDLAPPNRLCEVDGRPFPKLEQRSLPRK